MNNKELKNLPIGESNFSSIIKENKLYIDKTELIYKLITEGKYYFLSRPRRFEKSLLLSTFYKIFKERRGSIFGISFSTKEHTTIEYIYKNIGKNFLTGKG